MKQFLFNVPGKSLRWTFTFTGLFGENKIDQAGTDMPFFKAKEVPREVCVFQSIEELLNHKDMMGLKPVTRNKTSSEIIFSFFCLFTFALVPTHVKNDTVHRNVGLCWGSTLMLLMKKEMTSGEVS